MFILNYILLKSKKIFKIKIYYNKDQSFLNKNISNFINLALQTLLLMNLNQHIIKFKLMTIDIQF
jgi:hypothetical protein